MTDEPHSESARWWVGAVIEFVGYSCILLAGHLLFGVGTAWGWLAFLPAGVAAAYVTFVDHSGGPNHRNDEETTL